MKKHQKTGGKRLTRRALWLILAALLAAGTSVGALAAGGFGPFAADEDSADGYRVSTEDGTWTAASDSEDNNTYYLYQEGDDPETAEPIVTLTMDGNVWTYQFSVVDSETAEYYVTEFINREGAYELTTDPSYQLKDENGNIIYYTKTGSNGSVTLYNVIGSMTPPAFGGLTLTKKAQVLDASGNDVTSETDIPRFKFTIALSYQTVTDSEGNVTRGSAATAALLTGTQTYGDLFIQWTSTETPGDDGTVTVDYTGSAVTYLTADESVKLTDIPAGVAYTVSEEAAEEYTATWEINGAAPEGGDISGTILADTETEDNTARVVCTNKRTLPEPEPEPLTGSVLVKKLVTTSDGAEADDDKTEFSMKLSLTGLTAGETYFYKIYSGGNELIAEQYSAVTGGSADVSFSLSNGQYARFEGLPVGCTYQVKESGMDGYIPSYQLTGGGDDAVIVQSADAKYEYGQDLTTARETLDEAETVTPVTVTFTNEKPGTSTGDDTISIAVSKTWLNAGGEDESASHEGEEITLYLLRSLDYPGDDGEVLSTVYLNGTDDGWTYTWPKLERYNPGGEPYYYYIIEETVDGYSTVVTVTDAPYLDEDGNVQYETDDDGNETKTIKNDETKNYEFTVTNSASVELPYTGGVGTVPLAAVGLLLTAGAAALVPAVRRKRERGTR